MAIKLHRCSLMWFKAGMHPCWRVQSALDEQGIEYEVVTGPLRRGKREDVKRLTGQAAYPAIEFEDGTRLPRGVGGHGGADPRGPAVRGHGAGQRRPGGAARPSSRRRADGRRPGRLSYLNLDLGMP